jgi:hypothetical protein
MDQRCAGLPAAQTAVAPDELLERGHFAGRTVDPAVDQDVTDVRELVVAAQVLRRVLPERR